MAEGFGIWKKDGITRIITSNGDTFRYHYFLSPNIFEEIDALGLTRPTAKQNLYLIYDAQLFPKVDEVFGEDMEIFEKFLEERWLTSKYAQRILEELEEKCLVSNTLTQYGPEGVYINWDGKERDKWELRNIFEKEKYGSVREEKGVLISPDGKVRFTDYDYQRGDMPARDLKSNKIIIAQYGVDGARTLAKLADQYKPDPHVSAYIEEEANYDNYLSGTWDNGESDAMITGHASLRIYRKKGLYIYCESGSLWYDFAFGLEKKAEA